MEEVTREHVMTYTSPKEEGENSESFAVIGRKVPFPGVLTTEKEVPIEVPSPLETPIIIETPGMSVRIETITPVNVISAVEEPEFEIPKPPEPEIPLFLEELPSPKLVWLELPDLKIQMDDIQSNGSSGNGRSFNGQRAKKKRYAPEASAAMASIR